MELHERNFAALRYAENKKSLREWKQALWTGLVLGAIMGIAVGISIGVHIAASLGGL